MVFKYFICQKHTKTQKETEDPKSANANDKHK